MSYILDALRKSEQERQRGKVPDLNSYKDEPVQELPRHNAWPWIALAAVAISVAAVAIIWTSGRGSAPVPQPAGTMTAPVVSKAPVVQTPTVSTPQPTVSVPAPKPVAVPDPVPTAQPQPVSQTVVVDSRPPVQSAPTVVAPQQESIFEAEPPQSDYSAPAPSVAYMPQLEELSPSDRAGIPDMTFSSHMYSSMPRFRSIIINGKRLKEGEYFNQNLQVREITDKGVIMSNGNVLFSVDVLGRWAQ